MGLVVCLLAVAAAFVFSAKAGIEARVSDGVTYAPVWPSATGPGIEDYGIPHWVYIEKGIVVSRDPSLPADRHELLLWLPGTAPRLPPPDQPGAVRNWASHKLCLLAASLGYHVISLDYSNAQSASCCNGDADPSAFETFRSAIITGGTTARITVTRADSIENRLIQLLRMLAREAPDEGWDAFLNADGTICWQKIAVAGQSQGGGHSALIGIHHRVERVLCFSAPKDFSTTLNAPAAWYSEPSLTPKNRFFAFNDDQDRQGCTPEQQVANLRALGLDLLEPAVSVDGTSPPYGHSHILMTDSPGMPVDSRTAHGETISPNNSGVFGPVWRYMLTE